MAKVRIEHEEEDERDEPVEDKSTQGTEAEDDDEEYDFSDVIAEPKNKYITVDQDWGHIHVSADVLPGKGISLHRPTRREEIQIRTGVRKAFRTGNVVLDDVDIYSQNQEYIHHLLQVARDDKGAKIDWLAINPKSQKESDTYDEVQEAILSWLLRFRESEDAE